MKLPDFSLEVPLLQKGHTVIGVDEVGRGCLAGPVYVAACCVTKEKSMCSNYLKKIQNLGIQDSKKISHKKRMDLSRIMRAEGVCFAISSSSVNTINRKGIVSATQIAARNAVNKLIKQSSLKRPYILSDALCMTDKVVRDSTPIESIIKGDEKSITIASASIFAKIERDAYMTNLSQQYPIYNWQKNKGYGTKIHREAILSSGPCQHHRELFIKKLIKSAKI